MAKAEDEIRTQHAAFEAAKARQHALLNDLRQRRMQERARRNEASRCRELEMQQDRANRKAEQEAERNAEAARVEDDLRQEETEAVAKLLEETQAKKEAAATEIHDRCWKTSRTRPSRRSAATR